MIDFSVVVKILLALIIVGVPSWKLYEHYILKERVRVKDET